MGGTWDPNADTVAAATQRYARLGYEVRDITYPATIWPMGALSYDSSVHEGKRALRIGIDDFHRACPGSSIVVIGYSQGARIAGDVLSEISDDNTIDPVQIQGVLYADPRNDRRGIETVLPGLLPGITMSGNRSGFGDIPVDEVCIEGDGICDMPDPLHDPARFVDAVAGYFTKHPTYQPAMASAAAGIIASEPAIPALLADRGLTGVTLPPALPDIGQPYVVDAAPVAASILAALPALPTLAPGMVLPSLDDAEHLVDDISDFGRQLADTVAGKSSRTDVTDRQDVASRS